MFLTAHLLPKREASISSHRVRRLMASAVLKKMAFSALTRRLGVSSRCTVLFRTWLGVVTLLELCERFPALPWLYTDGGAFPRWAVLPAAEVAPFLRTVCVHAWYGGLLPQYMLSGINAIAAIGLISGTHPRAAAAVCWMLQLSSMMRNPQLSFILDRYLHVLLLLAACMPSPCPDGRRFRCSTASCVLTAQLLLIYMDAGYGSRRMPRSHVARWHVAGISCAWGRGLTELARAYRM